MTRFTHQIGNIATTIISELPLDEYNIETAAELTIMAAVQSGIPAKELIKALARLDFADYPQITTAEIKAARKAAQPVDLLSTLNEEQKP